METKSCCLETQCAGTHTDYNGHRCVTLISHLNDKLYEGNLVLYFEAHLYMHPIKTKGRVVLINGILESIVSFIH
jgi:hypothetical protein